MNKFKEWIDSKILILPLREYPYNEWLPYKSKNGFYLLKIKNTAFDSIYLHYYHEKSDVKYKWHGSLENDNKHHGQNNDWCLNEEDVA